jgi:hypothetical protein
MNPQAVQKFVDEIWMDDIVPELVEYIKIPNKSPHFDPDWEKNGYIARPHPSDFPGNPRRR